MKKTSRLGLLALALSGLAATGHAEDRRTLTLSTYAVSQPGFERYVYTPFRAKCGCNLVVETGNNADRIAKLDARRQNQVVDMVLFSDFGMLEAARKGLVQPLDYGRLKNYDDLEPFAKDPVGGKFAVGYTAYSVGLVYRSDKLPAVTSWKDLWSPALKGRVAMPDITTTQGPLTLHMAEVSWGGTSPSYATGMDKVLANRGNVVTFVKNSAQLAALFAQDEIWLAPVPRFVWAQMTKSGMPLKWASPKEGQAAGLNVMGIVAGSKNADLAYQLMDFWLSKEVQTALALNMIDSPVNKSVTLPKEIAEVSTYGEEQMASLKFVKPDTILANRAGWVDAWNKGMAR
ncbi:ABC transporter substrate-binding protein [Ideonella azotifigens]|nr:ABC transporter substrate-binding protein [Ideonella azotifigens]MCD2340542.1 ABC transporter substrate-binding protein [Ideonella azotifigens]